jgi:hypothetical protein
MINLHGTVDEQAIRTCIIISVAFRNSVRQIELSLKYCEFEYRALAVKTAPDTVFSGFMSTVRLPET